MELIDTHCHLGFEQFNNCVDEVIERSRSAGVTSWITVGTSPDENRKAIKLAERFDNMYAAVGIHPHYADNATAEDISRLKELAQGKKTVAIGETGLDFHDGSSSHLAQKRLFAQQLQIARELKLPVIIHSRDAFDETLDVLEQSGEGIKAVFHCFSGSAQDAAVVLERGFYISFTGVITFKNAEPNRSAARIVPLERLMIETDCPYLSPEPKRNQKINEPAFLIHTALKLAELKGMDLENLAGELTRTTKGFFGLPDK